jgi:hypothetical protein
MQALLSKEIIKAKLTERKGIKDLKEKLTMRITILSMYIMKSTVVQILFLPMIVCGKIYSQALLQINIKEA